MSIPVEQLIARMEWAAARGLAELTLTLDGRRVTILRGSRSGAVSVDAPAVLPPGDAVAGAPRDSTGFDQVTAPLSGLCHLAAEAGGAPFVSLGHTVEAGQILCLIEAMKVMTQVPAPRAGTVRAILVTDGDSVDAGAPLMRLE